jgi:hypothetical protein
MGKNRKVGAEPFRIRQLGVIVLLCCACAAVGAGYVYQKKAIYRLGRWIRQMELALEESRRSNWQLEAQVAQLKSLPVLEERVRTLQLNLVVPSQGQIIRIDDPATLNGRASGLPPALKSPPSTRRP